MNDPSNHIIDRPNGSKNQEQIQSGHAISSDGIELYWRAVGKGPWIVCCNGVGVSTFFWKYLVAHFSHSHTVIVWDYRGHGLSQRSLEPDTADMRIERHADDLSTVLEAVATSREIDAPKPALVVGHSMGVQVALETRRRHPQYVAG